MNLSRHCIRFSLVGIIVLIGLISLVGCGTSRHLTNQDVMWVDDDRYHVSQPPEERNPDYSWDFIHRSFLYPVDRFINFPRYLGSNEAKNINTLGEVPDSSWYTNRHARKRMTIEELATGPNQGSGPDMKDVWTIIGSKTQGVTPGFTINDKNGEVYFIKFDPPQYPEMATGAEVISTLLFYASGYNTAENYIVHFTPNNLVIGEGTEILDEQGNKRQMTEADLAGIFKRVHHNSDGTIRAIASKRLSGQPIGPYSYIGRRKGDPNDIYNHRDRRELRGLKVVASWLNHVDVKGPNSLDMYVTENGKSYVKHYLMDFGATLGSASTHSHDPPTGHEYSFDTPVFFKSFFTLGLLTKPWYNAKTVEDPAIGFFEADTFRPGAWKESYTNAAFLEMQNQDAYWGAKIVMSFTPDEIRAAVKQGQYSNPKVEKYIADTLIQRREKIGRYWFSKVSPLDNFEVKASSALSLHFKDLGVVGGLWQPAQYHYELRHYQRNRVIDSGSFSGAAGIPISADVLSAMDDLVGGAGPDKSRFFYYKLKIERDGKKSKEVRVYVYRGENSDDKLKIVRIERDG